MTERLILKLYKIHGKSLNGKVITVDKHTLRYFTGQYQTVHSLQEGYYHFNVTGILGTGLYLTLRLV